MLGPRASSLDLRRATSPTPPLVSRGAQDEPTTEEMAMGLLEETLHRKLGSIIAPDDVGVYAAVEQKLADE